MIRTTSLFIGFWCCFALAVAQGQRSAEKKQQRQSRRQAQEIAALPPCDTAQYTLRMPASLSLAQDELQLQARGLTRFKLTFFSRWGEKLLVWEQEVLPSQQFDLQIYSLKLNAAMRKLERSSQLVVSAELYCGQKGFTRQSYSLVVIP